MPAGLARHPARGAERAARQALAALRAVGQLEALAEARRRRPCGRRRRRRRGGRRCRSRPAAARRRGPRARARRARSKSLAARRGDARGRAPAPCRSARPSSRGGGARRSRPRSSGRGAGRRVATSSVSTVMPTLIVGGDDRRACAPASARSSRVLGGVEPGRADDEAGAALGRRAGRARRVAAGAVKSITTCSGVQTAPRSSPTATPSAPPPASSPASRPRLGWPRRLDRAGDAQARRRRARARGCSRPIRPAAPQTTTASGSDKRVLAQHLPRAASRFAGAERRERQAELVGCTGPSSRARSSPGSDSPRSDGGADERQQLGRMSVARAREVAGEQRVGELRHLARHDVRR